MRRSCRGSRAPSPLLQGYLHSKAAPLTITVGLQIAPNHAMVVFFNMLATLENAAGVVSIWSGLLTSSFCSVHLSHPVTAS